MNKEDTVKMCKLMALGMAKHYLSKKMISADEYAKMVKYINEN